MAYLELPSKFVLQVHYEKLNAKELGPGFTVHSQDMLTDGRPLQICDCSCSVFFSLLDILNVLSFSVIIIIHMDR